MTDRDANGYLRWELAGGPNECSHGYASGIPCPQCDLARARAMLPYHDVIGTKRAEDGSISVLTSGEISSLTLSFGFTL